MQDLRLVAANERGSHLVLRSVDGDKFVVSIDERLRAAVRGDHSRSTPEGELVIDLRPRDIQARSRAGGKRGPAPAKPDPSPPLARPAPAPRRGIAPRP